MVMQGISELHEHGIVLGEDKKTKKTKWTPLNAEEKKNLWRSLDFAVLFEGTGLMGEKDIWKNTVLCGLR